MRPPHRSLQLSLGVLAIAFALSVAISGCQSSSTKEAEGQAPKATLTELADVSRWPNVPPIPVLPGSVVSRVSFSSCADAEKPQPLWPVMLGKNPQLHVNLGDNVYFLESTSEKGVRRFLQSYGLELQNSDYANFRSKIPMLSTWDDNDYGQNDGGFENPEKDLAKEAFLQFYSHEKQFLSDKQGGVYHSVVFGAAPKRLQVLVLDTRWFRSPLEKNEKPTGPLDRYQGTKDQKKTLLGEEQWTWLEHELAQPAELRILASSIQVVAEDHGFEKWMNFPHERNRLFQLLKKYKIKNLVVLSGDRHHGEMSQIKTAQGTLITDLTASGINKTSTLPIEKNQHRIGEKFTKENFGFLNIDWSRRHILAELVGLDGETVNEIELKF